MLTKELLIYLNRDGIEKQSHAELVDLCEDLLNRVRTLEERLSKNSTNSSIVSATCTFNIPNNKDQTLRIY